MSRSTKQRDAIAWFAGPLKRLRAEYGDAVQVGTPVAADEIALLEKQLGVRFPADYSAFLASYGFLRVRDEIIYGIPTSTTPDDDVDVRMAAEALDELVGIRQEHDDIDLTDWYADRGAVVPLIGSAPAFDDDATGDIRGTVYAVDRRGTLWDLSAVPPERCEDTFPQLVESLVHSLLGGRGRAIPLDTTYRSPEPFEPNDSTRYRRLIPITPLVERGIADEPAFADAVALFKNAWEVDNMSPLELPESLRDIPPQEPFTGEIVELTRYLPALFLLVDDLDEQRAIAARTPLARAICGDHDLHGLENQTSLHSAVVVAELADALASIVQDVRAAAQTRSAELTALNTPLEGVLRQATRVRDAYRTARSKGFGMLVRYSAPRPDVR